MGIPSKGYALPVFVLSVDQWKAKQNAMHLPPASTRGQIKSAEGSNKYGNNTHVLTEQMRQHVSNYQLVEYASTYSLKGQTHPDAIRNNHDSYNIDTYEL